MSFLTFDTGEMKALAVDLVGISRKTTPAMVKVFTDAGKDLEDTWRRNAEATSGEHGKHYPKSIDHELVLSTNIVVEVGPNPGKPQGGMSFEDGSVNQPPHNDGKMAADEVVPRIARRIDSALGLLGL